MRGSFNIRLLILIKGGSYILRLMGLGQYDYFVVCCSGGDLFEVIEMFFDLSDMEVDISIINFLESDGKVMQIMVDSVIMEVLEGKKDDKSSI